MPFLNVNRRVRFEFLEELLARAAPASPSFPVAAVASEAETTFSVDPTSAAAPPAAGDVDTQQVVAEYVTPARYMILHSAAAFGACHFRSET